MSEATLKNRRWSNMQPGVEPDDYITKMQLDGVGKLTPGYNYIIVPTTDDPIENGQNLLLAYEYAKDTLAPQVGTLAVDNRVTVLLMPGLYELGDGDLLLDTSYIDIIGLSDYKPANNFHNYIYSGSLTISAIIQAEVVKHVQLISNGVTITYGSGVQAMLAGLHIETTWDGEITGTSSDKAALWFDSSSMLIMSECTFAANTDDEYPCHRTNTPMYGIVLRCSGGLSCFGSGAGGAAYGRFEYCNAGSYSYGGNGGECNGVFYSCKGAMYCFGGGGGIAKGWFDSIKMKHNWDVTFYGKLANTTIYTEIANDDGITNVQSGAEFDNCKILPTGTANSLGTYDSDVEIKSKYSCFTKAWNAEITNTLSSDTVTDPMGLADAFNILNENLR